MTESDDTSKKKSGLGVALGIAIGLPVGAGAGMLLFDNIGLGAALGLALGVALGAGWEYSGRGEKPE
ncbi:MAG: glycine zipper family protein [Acidimicrobiia bacterium]